MSTYSPWRGECSRASFAFSSEGGRSGAVGLAARSAGTAAASRVRTQRVSRAERAGAGAWNEPRGGGGEGDTGAGAPPAASRPGPAGLQVPAARPILPEFASPRSLDPPETDMRPPSTGSRHDRIRVAVVLDHLGAAGSPRAAVAQATSLDPAAWQVEIASLERPDPGGEETRLPVEIPVRRPGLAGFAGWLKAFAPDLVHSHHVRATLACRVASPLAGDPPLVATCHELSDWRERRHRPLHLLTRVALHHCAVVLAASHAVRSAIAAEDPRLGARPRVLYNGTGLSAFAAGGGLAAGAPRGALGDRRGGPAARRAHPRALQRHRPLRVRGGARHAGGCARGPGLPARDVRARRGRTARSAKGARPPARGRIAGTPPGAGARVARRRRRARARTARRTRARARPPRARPVRGRAARRAAVPRRVRSLRRAGAQRRLRAGEE